MQLTDEKLTEEELNEYYLITKDQFEKNHSLFNDVHSDIIELFDSIEDDICIGILNKLEEFTNIFKLIDNFLISFKIILDKYLKYNDKNQQKKLQILQLKNELDNLKQELLNYNSEIDKKENEYNVLQNEYNNVLKRLDSYNNNSIDVSLDNISSTRNNTNEDVIKKKSTKSSLLMKENKELQNYIEELNNTVSILKNNFEQVKFENSNLKDKLISAKKENESKNQRITFSESKENKIKNENNRLKAMVASLKNENENLYNENTYLKSEVKLLSKKDQTSNLQNSTFDYNIYQKEKAENKKEEDEKDLKEEIISLNSIGFSNEKKEENNQKEKTSSSGKIYITPKSVVSSMNKDFKKLTKLRLTKLDNNNTHDRSRSFAGNDSSRNENVTDSYYMYDYFF